MVKVSPKLVIADVCDVTLESLADGKVIMTAEAQTTSISQTIDEQEIRGGRGGGLIATIQSQKTIETQLTDALFSLDYIELVQGSDIEEGEVSYWVNAKATVTADGFTIEDTGVTKALITGADGTQTPADVETGVITVDTTTAFPDATEGDEVEILVQKTATGQMVEIRTDRFPKKYKMTYRTVALDPKSMEHVHDVIIQFDEVQPSANFDLGFEMSTPMTPEISFKVTKPEGCNGLGRFILTDPIKDEVDC